MIYEYLCSGCNTTYEQRRRVEDRNTPVICPCGLATLTRVITAPRGFTLKGEGFYKPAAKPKDGDE